MATKLLVCLVVVAAATTEVPLFHDDYDTLSDVSSYKCARQCKDNPSKFKYKPSETYVYEYKADAQTSIVGASEDKTRLHIETLANIEVISKCEFALRLQNVDIHRSEAYTQSQNKRPERSHEFQRALTENTIRFSFDDGVIQDVCHPSNEKVWVLNFKKGLLSAFQNSMANLQKNENKTEVDIQGKCKAEYKLLKEWSWTSNVKVVRTKNLLACSNRDSLRTALPLVPYDVDSPVQNFPLTKSSHECKQIINPSGILGSASCTESHIYVPFSSGQSGAATEIEQTLTLKTVKNGVETSDDYIESRTSLLFRHVNGIDEVENSREAAEQKLKEICAQTKMAIRAETPRLFSELVHIVKVLEFSDIKRLYQRIKRKELCMQNDKAMKFLLDTIPIAGTSETVKMIAEIFNTDTDIISDIQKQTWLISLSLIPEPTEGMLPALKRLLDGPKKELALLPVSALLNTMCEKNVNCELNNDFQKIVQTINGRIDHYCNSDETTKVLRILRAIGNIGHGKKFLATLKTCMTSQHAPLEFKVAAANAYRRFPCMENEEKGPLFEMYESQNADPELRIMSFLSLMRCPRDSVLKKIVEQQDKESDANVGTFVYTHLENLKESKDPHKKSLTQVMKRFNVRRMGDSGFKSSRSFELSEVLNRINMGYVTNFDLIWSPTSVFPRAARFNLTLPLFGKAFNVFDVGARMDGIEHFIQKYFGTEGYFTQSGPKELEAFIYARVFGNELFFKNVKGTKEFEDIKSLFNFEEILEKLTKKNEHNLRFTHTQQLIDESLIIPTAIGLPLNLTVNSSVTVDIGAKNQFDLSGILSRTKSIIVSTDVTASAGLEVTGSMMVDAFICKQGLRMRNTLHSNVNFKSNLEVKKREIVSFEIQSPQEKQELFDARSQFFIVDDGYEKEQEMIIENRREMKSCTGDKFNKVVGLELCGELQYANASMTENAPYFPLTGPFRASVILNKKDTQRNYRILAKWAKKSKKLEAQLQIDTPGSRVDRHISADVSIGNHKIKHVDVVLMSPWKRLVVNGTAAKNDDLAKITGRITVDDTKKYTLMSEVKMNQKGKRSEYLPFVEVEHDGERITLLKGSLIHNENKDISTDLEMNDLNNNPYLHEGKLIFRKQEKRLVFSIGEKNKKQFTIKIGSSLKKSGKNKQNIKLDPELIIQTPRGEIVSLISSTEFQKKPLRVIGSMKLDSIRMRKAVTFKVDVKQKRNKYPITVKLYSPVVTGDIKGHVESRKNSYSSTMTLNYNTKSFKDRILWSGKFLNRSKNAYIEYNFNSNLKSRTMPEYNTDTHLEITHKKATTADLTIHYGERINKKRLIHLSGSVNANIKNIKQASIKADMKARIPEKKVNVKIEVDHRHTPRLVDSEVKLHLAPFVKNDINAAINIQNKGKSMYAVTAEGSLDVKGKRHTLKSDLIQKSKKRFMHTLVVSCNKKLHKLATVYRNTDYTHDIKSSLESAALEEPLNIKITADVKSPSDFHIQANVSESQKELYSMDALSKMEIGIAGKWKLEVVHPKRTIKAHASFNKEKNRVKTDALVNWNAKSEKQPVPQIHYTGIYTHIPKPNSLLLKGNVVVVTPFKHFEKLSSNMNFLKSKSKMVTSGKAAWGGIHKQISSQLSVNLPLGMENIKMSFEAKTPLKNYREVELEIDHELKADIKTLLKGKVGKDQGELILEGEKSFDNYLWHIQGNLTLKTPFRSARKIFVTAEHSADDKDVKGVMKIDKDGEKYGADVSMHMLDGPEIVRSGKLILSRQAQKAETSFTYKTEDGQRLIKASFDSILSRNKKISVDGSYRNINDLSLNIDAKTPFRSLRKVCLELEHKVDENQLHSKVMVVNNRAKTGFDVLLKDEQGEASANVLLLLSPLYEKDVTLISKVQYEYYPMTASTQLRWTPYSNIDLSGSYKGKTLDDLELNLKVTTPFKKFENINMLASHVLDDSVRVMHFNIDYDVRKMIDVEIKTQNGEEKKLARVKIQSPCPYFQSLDTGVSIDMRRGTRSKADLQLETTPGTKYEGNANLSIMENDNVRGKVEMKTPVEGYRHVEGSIDMTQGRKDKDWISSLKLRKDYDDFIDIKAETGFSKNDISIKITTKGRVLEHLAKTLDEFDIQRELKEYHFLKSIALGKFYPMIYKDKEGNLMKEIVMEFKMKHENPVLQLDTSFTVFIDEKAHQRAISIRITGTKMDDIDIDVSLTDGKLTFEGKLKLNFKSLDDIQIQAILKDIFGQKYGIEFNHSLNDNRLETSGKIYLFELESGFDFLMTDIKHIELKIKIAEYLDSTRDIASFRYIHESQDNRISCSAVYRGMNGTISSMSLMAESSPIHLFSLELMHSIDKITISGDYDKTKINGLVKWGKNKEISLTGVHDNFKNPRITLKTPLRQLQLLSVNVDGEWKDGSSRFALKFNDNDQVAGNAVLKYENLSQMMLAATMKVTLEETENSMKFEVKNAQSPRKETHLLLALNDLDKLVIDLLQRSDDDTESKNELDVELRYPSVNLKSKGILLNLDGNKDKAFGNIQVLVASGKALDANIDIVLKDERKATIVVRKPKPMEYRFTDENFSGLKENEIYFNWDRTDADANLIVRGTMKDESSTYKLDKSLSLKLIFPSRSIGLEHSISGNRIKLHSSGKVYWSDDRDSQLGYELKMNDLSNRRRTVHDGELKIQLPTRTIGVFGTRRDLANHHDIESTFSWDLDNDDTKKIGMKAKLLKGDHMQAEVSLILPKEAHVDSTLVMNRGNTILEGTTQIFYSDDSSKTLTLFSKVEKNPEHHSFFYTEEKRNYSIEFGLKHPDSRVDLKVLSHLGLDDERWTTSIGLDYLNIRRQNMNSALFVEINKLKKEIHLIATSPYMTVGFTGGVVNEDPLELRAVKTVDNEEKMSAHLLVNSNAKKYNLDFTNVDRKVTISAHYPNQTAFQLESVRQENGEVQQYFRSIIELSSPNVLQTRVYWKPGMLVELRNAIFDNCKLALLDWKDLIDEVALDLRKEVTSRYDIMVPTFYEDVKSLNEFLEGELVSVEEEVKQLKHNLQQRIEFTNIKIGDLDLNEELFKLQGKMLSYLKEVWKITKPFKRVYRNSIQSIENTLDKLRNLPADKFFNRTIIGLSWMEIELFGTPFLGLSALFHIESVEDMEELLDRFETWIDPRPIIKDLNMKIKTMLESETYPGMAGLYAPKIATVLNKVGEMVGKHPVTNEIKEMLQESISDLYEQLKWAHHYWALDDNVPKRLDELAQLIGEIIGMEVREYLKSKFSHMPNPLTHFDPVEGELVIEIPLIVGLDRIDKMPDFELYYREIKWMLWMYLMMSSANHGVVIGSFQMTMSYYLLCS